MGKGKGYPSPLEMRMGWKLFLRFEWGATVEISDTDTILDHYDYVWSLVGGIVHFLDI